MYRPSSLVRPFLVLALSALVLPLRAQDEAAPNPAPAPEEQTAPQAAEQPQHPPYDLRQMQMQAQAPLQPALGRDPREVRREQVEMRLRVMMSDFGIDNVGKQDALISYLAEDEAGKASVREAGKRLLLALRRGTDAARTRDLVAVYKAALDADKERRVAAQTALDAKIGFSLDPRLEAALWLFGVLGEGQAGLPLNTLTTRPNQNQGRPFPPPNFGPTGGRYAPQYGGAPGNAAPQAGTIFGTVSSKGEGWLEVRDQRGNLERYMPFWTAATVAGNNNTAAGGYDRAVLEAMNAAKVGDTVRLEWVWSERKRVVKLEPWTAPLPDNTPPDAAQNDAPNVPGYGADPGPPAPPQQQ